jgi:hypothetical protein
MILVGAHYLPFVFLYGMRMFWALGLLLVGAGILIALYWSTVFSAGAWFTGAVMLVFASVGRAIARRNRHGTAISSRRFRLVATDALMTLFSCHCWSKKLENGGTYGEFCGVCSR